MSTPVKNLKIYLLNNNQKVLLKNLKLEEANTKERKRAMLAFAVALKEQIILVPTKKNLSKLVI